jgi:hypothetical protein
MSHDSRVAIRWLLQTREHGYRGAFASSIWPQQTKYLPLLYFERNVINSQQITKSFG